MPYKEFNNNNNNKIYVACEISFLCSFPQESVRRSSLQEPDKMLAFDL